MIKEHKVLFVLAVSFFCLIAGMSCLQHYTFQTDAWDMAIFNQSFYLTVSGGPFMYNSIEAINHFGVHFSPILLLLVPLYAVFKSPYTLLIVQSAAIAVSVIPFYFYALKKIGLRGALLLSACYLLYPSLHFVALHEFHEVAFAIPLVFSFFYFFEERKYFLATISLIALAAVAENMIIVCGFIGVYIFLFKNRTYGAVVTVLSAIYFVMVAQVLMPLLGGSVARLDRYDHFGESSLEIIWTMVSKPGLTAETVFTPQKALYLAKLLLPLALLPLFATKELLLLLPGLMQNLLTDFVPQFNNKYQYDAILIPFLFFATVATLQQANHVRRERLYALLYLSSAAGFLLLSPLSPLNIQIHVFTDTKLAYYRLMRDQVPPGASVAAQTNIAAHVSNRSYINLIGRESQRVDYVLADREETSAFDSQEALDAYLEAYMATGEYEKFQFEERYTILRKRNDF